jgi:hypothetical protein
MVKAYGGAYAVAWAEQGRTGRRSNRRPTAACEEVTFVADWFSGKNAFGYRDTWVFIHLAEEQSA